MFDNVLVLFSRKFLPLGARQSPGVRRSKLGIVLTNTTQFSIVEPRELSRAPSGRNLRERALANTSFLACLF